MRQLVGLCLVVFVGLVSSAEFFVQAQEPAKPAAKKAAAPSSVFQTASELKWTDAPDAKGVQLATVWGNAEKGPHGSFAKFAAGTQLPLHTHSAGGRTAGISGTMVFALEGQSPRELGPGSYSFLPGGVRHTTGCKAGADCLIFTYWLGAFDLKPVGAAEKK